MNSDYESLEELSKRFQAHMIENQKKLNKLRASQFNKMINENTTINFLELRKKHQEFDKREKSQLAILAEEMNELLAKNIHQYVEDESFKNNERQQEKILLEELEKERSSQLSNALKLSSNELETPLMSLIVHVDMLLQKTELTEKQKNHLKNVRQNILSGIEPNDS